ncbi:hypothetical protein [Leifsonia sp. NPDC080035]|uniref:DUF3052 domain-containing protein n=1 Tax=Leifsonia sp. NPDC080035 TaxID=3143936 RepID=A0AAU7GDI3_9MICO
MAKTVAEKLLVRPGDALGVSGASEPERALLDPLPDGVTESAPAAAAVAVTFVRTRDELLERFAGQLPVLGGARAVWFLYPKGGRADVNRDVIIAESGAFGWRPVSNVSVDDVWSAVRVRPLADGEAPVG